MAGYRGRDPEADAWLRWQAGTISDEQYDEEIRRIRSGSSKTKARSFSEHRSERGRPKAADQAAGNRRGGLRPTPGRSSSPGQPTKQRAEIVGPYSTWPRVIPRPDHGSRPEQPLHKANWLERPRAESYSRREMTLGHWLVEGRHEMRFWYWLDTKFHVNRHRVWLWAVLPYVLRFTMMCVLAAVAFNVPYDTGLVALSRWTGPIAFFGSFFYSMATGRGTCDWLEGDDRTVREIRRDQVLTEAYYWDEQGRRQRS